MRMWEWNSNVLSVFFFFILLCFEFEKTENQPRYFLFIYCFFKI